MTDPIAPSQQPVYAAHPLIEVAGQSPDLLITNLVALTVTEEEGGLAALEATFTNSSNTDQDGIGLAFEHGASPLTFGAEIKVGMGEAEAPIELFRGRITALEAAFSEAEEPRLTVLAEDGLLGARLKRRTRVHPAGTVAALVEGIAADLGLRPAASGLDAAAGIQVQLDETDLAFLRRVLARHDADVQVVADELQASPRARVQRQTVTLAYPGMIRRVSALADLAHQASCVTWSGWDVAQGEAITATSNADADLGPGDGDRSGAQLLEQAFGRRAEHLGAIACRDQGEAQALVNAAFSARARRFMRYELRCNGDPRLRVGTHLAVRGLGARFSGAAYVTRVRHRYDLAHGYECDVLAECARPGEQP